MYYFNHQYRPAPCLYISPLPGRLAEWTRLHPLPCMNLTQGPLVKRKSNIGASDTAGPRPPPTHTVLVQLFPSSRTRKWKAQTKGPLATPLQVSWSIGSPYVPPMEACSVLGSRRRKLGPRGKNEAKNHHATMATHPSLLANY